ncbi:hypothetical protein SLS62_004592 [Diatrype stigma]|uniref:SRP9 domain-containing protein n=1 Tax=Diatrype stigma TaxID=117547 RepID=A0AAN9UUN4_9PEZI
MPYYATSQEWLHQSSLLLEARPSTTRITTKYSIARPKPRKTPSSTSTETTKAAPTTTAAAEKPPRGALTLKTYDPVSGATLKYRTTKAAEVSRLILSLGRLGSRMAGLPGGGPGEDEVMADVGAGAGAAVERAGTPAAAATEKEPSGGSSKGTGQPQQQQGGGKGKKKRGKK